MGFEEAPPYSSPVDNQIPPVPPLPNPETLSNLSTRPPALNVPQLPTIERLPSIRIIEGTPIEPRQHEFPSPTKQETIHEDDMRERS
ncbi:hypothetical protein H2203_003599 [Taxawa tesnikishii (nom. ined.)]|nr:hypothetical protein H2203_003599 [Dothideales sp. JES 119]